MTNQRIKYAVTAQTKLKVYSVSSSRLSFPASINIKKTHSMLTP